MYKDPRWSKSHRAMIRCKKWSGIMSLVLPDADAPAVLHELRSDEIRRQLEILALKGLNNQYNVRPFALVIYADTEPRGQPPSTIVAFVCLNDIVARSEILNAILSAAEQQYPEEFFQPITFDEFGSLDSASGKACIAYANEQALASHIAWLKHLRKRQVGEDVLENAAVLSAIGVVAGVLLTIAFGKSELWVTVIGLWAFLGAGFGLRWLRRNKVFSRSIDQSPAPRIVQIPIDVSSPSDKRWLGNQSTPTIQ